MFSTNQMHCIFITLGSFGPSVYPYIYLSVRLLPPWGPGSISRECVLRIPMRVLKATKMGRRNIAQVADTALKQHSRYLLWT